MEKAWRLIIDGPREPKENMAIDDALLLGMAEEGAAPVLRVYRWLYPCVSIGKFQRIDGSLLSGQGMAVVRRPTGGGLVCHKDPGITYSMAYREDGLAVAKGAAASYRQIHEWVAAALKGLGIEAGLYRPAGAPSKPFGACFDSPVESDVVFEGRKIAGAAQRRKSGAVLHQGEVSLPLDVWRKYSYNMALNVFIDGLSRQLNAVYSEEVTR